MDRGAEHSLRDTARLDAPWLAAVEVILFVLALAGQTWHLWELLPGAQEHRATARCVLPLLCTAVLVVSLIRTRVDVRSLGVVPVRWQCGWCSVLSFTTLSLAGLTVLGFAWAEASLGTMQSSWLIQYVPGMIGQQFALQCFLNNRLYDLSPGWEESHRSRIAVVGSTLAFTLLHAPNPALMAGTLWTGAFWTWHFRRHGNLPALVVSHLLLGTGAMILLGEGPMMRLRVGWPAMKLLLGH